MRSGPTTPGQSNQFASDLLLPRRLFVPLAEKKPINLITLHDLAITFQMSLTATALKLVEFGSYPAMLIFNEGGKRKWFIRPRSVPQSLWPTTCPEQGTVTHTVLSDLYANEAEDDVHADKWFERQGADRYYVRESCFETVTIPLYNSWWESEQRSSI